MSRIYIHAFLLLLLFAGGGRAVAQAVPDLGVASNYTIFTSSGTVSNTGNSRVIGNVGTNSGTTIWNRNVNGIVHTVVPDSPTIFCATAIQLAYLQMNARTPTNFPSGSLGSGQVLNSGVHKIFGNATLTSNLILDGGRDPNAVFIIVITGRLITAPFSKVELRNGTQACNVFWRVENSVTLGLSSIFQGTFISAGTITMNKGASLDGRAFSIAGAITCDSVRAYLPIGCDPALAGPSLPSVTITGCYGLYTRNGQISNPGGTTDIRGDIGCYSGGTDPTPLFPGITGNVYYATTGTFLAGASLVVIVSSFKKDAVPYDIQLLFPATVGQGLTLTPHTYLIDAPTTVSDTLIFDGQRNPTASFLIQVHGSLSIAPNTVMKLINGARASNIFWIVEGNVNVGTNAELKGNIMGDNSSFNIASGARIDGRLHTTAGDIVFGGASATLPSDGGGPCGDPIINKKPVANDDTVVICQNSNTITINVQANDHDTDMNRLLTIMVSGPRNGRATYTGLSLRYTPNIGFNGIDTIEYRIKDDGKPPLEDTAFLFITVLPLPQMKAGDDREICVGDTTIIGDTALPDVVFRWYLNTTLMSDTSVNPVVSPTATAGYILRDTSLITGCFNKDTVLVFVNPLPVVFAGLDTAICYRDSTRIGDTVMSDTASFLYAHTWRPVDGLDIDTLANPMVSPEVTTVYVLTDTNRLTGCFNKDSVVITIIPLPVTNTGPDRPICIGESLQIGDTSTINVLYKWQPPDGLTLDTIPNPIATPTTNATYVLMTLDTMTTCRNADTIFITVNPLPTALAGADTAICLLDSAILGAPDMAGYAYAWSPAAGLGNAAAAQPKASPAADAVYQLVATIVATGCHDTDSVAVTVRPLPTVATGIPQAICLGSSTQIGADGVAGQTYKWLPASGLASDTEPKTTANPAATTTYTLTTRNTWCPVSKEWLVTVNPLPAAETGPDLMIPIKAPKIIGAPAVPGNSYQWLPATDISAANVAQPEIRPGASITYTLTETIDATGCKNSNTVVVTVTDGEFYNAFSPNGDGKNDEWVIPFIAYFPTNKVIVFNRWGSEVWSGTNYDNSSVVFKGKNMSGDELPDGTYYYSITHGGQEKNGWVLIKR